MMTIEERARARVAEHATSLDEEFLLNDMLGLMNPSEPFPELWQASCDTPDCPACAPLHGIMVEAPAYWRSDMVIQALREDGHTCEGGNQFAHAAGIVELFPELVPVHIRLS